MEPPITDTLNKGHLPNKGQDSEHYIMALKCKPRNETVVVCMIIVEMEKKQLIFARFDHSPQYIALV